MQENEGKVQFEKFTAEELEKALLFLDGSIGLEDIGTLIKSEDIMEKRNAFLDALLNEGKSGITTDMVYEVIEAIYTEIARRMDKKDFGKLSRVKCDLPKLIDQMISHPEYYEGGLELEDILLLMSHERNSIKSLNMWSNEPIGQMLRATSYSQDEKHAVVVYTGEKPYEADGGKAPVLEKYMYELFNMLFYPDLKNESARIFEEGKTPPVEVLYDMKTLLEFSRNLYKALYKSSRKLPAELKVERVDRVATIEAMEECGNVVSNFSATLGKGNGMFSKRHTAIVNGTCRRGVVAGDFAEILKGYYGYKDEKELLIAPGAKVEISELEVTSSDMQIASFDDDTVDRKVNIEFYADSGYIDPLTPEEYREMSELESYLYDEKNSQKAQDFITRLADVRLQNSRERQLPQGRKKSKILMEPTISFKEAVDMIDPDLVKGYLEFKGKFIRYYNLMTREVAMEVESSLERAYSNYREDRMESSSELWAYGVRHPRTERFERKGIVLRPEREKVISDQEMKELASGERLEDITQSIGTFSKVVGRNDLKISREDD